MNTSDITFFIVLIAATAAAYFLKKLTFWGAFTGGLMAVSTYFGFLFPGIYMLGAFFVLATFATSFNKSKIVLNRVNHQQTRDARQVLANGGVAGALGIINFFVPYIIYPHPLLVMMAASLASATADTLSSELGEVYGKRCYNIITLKPDERGRDGVISLEGTLIGVAGSLAIALIFVLCFGVQYYPHASIIVIAGTAGNLFDSFLGATLERRGVMQNNMVNFANTAFAALVAYLLMLI